MLSIVTPFAKDQRGVSPVVGTVLLLGIVVLLISVSAYLFFGISEEKEPSPDVVLELESEGEGFAYVLVHNGGDRLNGDKVTLRGAADPEGLVDNALTADNEAQVYPVEESINVVYTGEHGTTYILATFEVDRSIPEPDAGCDWVDNETNGGTEDAKITGEVVNCDVETNKVVEVSNGGIIIGETLSDTKTVDADNAQFYGDVTAEDVVNIQDGTVTGSVTSQTADVKLDNSTVNGEVTAQKVVELQGGSSVGGSVKSTNKKVKILDGSSVDGDVVSDTEQVKVIDSEVSGSIATDGTVTLDGATIDGEIYVDDSDFSCSSSTIAGQNCSEYDPKSPDDY